MPIYDPPASIDDFSRRPAEAATLRAAWDETIRGFIADTKNPNDPELTISGLFDLVK